MDVNSLALPETISKNIEVVVVESEISLASRLLTSLSRNGVNAVVVGTAAEAAELIDVVAPDLVVISTDSYPEAGLGLLRAMRERDNLSLVPVIITATQPSSSRVIRAFNAGADDVADKSLGTSELVARIQSKLQRRPIPASFTQINTTAETLSEKAFLDAVEREIKRSERLGSDCIVAVFELAEADSFTERFSTRTVKSLTKQLGTVVKASSRLTDTFGNDERTRLLVLLPDTPATGAEIALSRRSRAVVEHKFTADAEQIRLTPIVGFAAVEKGITAQELLRRATIASQLAHLNHAQSPVEYDHSTHELIRDIPRLVPLETEVVVIEQNQKFANELSIALSRAGVNCVAVSSGSEAAELIDVVAPDLLVISTDSYPEAGLGLLRAMRERENLSLVPVIVTATQPSSARVVRALNLGADDVADKSLGTSELVARIHSKLQRRPVPASLTQINTTAETLSEKAFIDAVDREIKRSERLGSDCIVAVFELAEAETFTERFSTRAVKSITKQLGSVVKASSRLTDTFGNDEQTRLLVLLPDTPATGAEIALSRRSRAVVEHKFTADAEQIRLTPIVGFAAVEKGITAQELLRRATIALGEANAVKDIIPQQYEVGMEVAAKSRERNAFQKIFDRYRDSTQFLTTTTIGIVVPFFIYLGLYSVGISVYPTLYIVIVVSLLITALLVWVEGFLAWKRIDPPPAARPEGKATAIIAAYLPNEALTLESTLEAFFAIEYPEIQIILAYNTPVDMEIENRFKALAELHPNFVPYRVLGSTSKSQNVNSALTIATGEMIGVFDADAMPEPGTFKRAWRWISNGVDVIQGHNAVRNGDASMVSRTVAVEFEAIYAVSHPGRERLHGFGIFGGSNGYWRGDLLRAIRMRGFMLTEDIDSSMRVVAEGGKIISDPHIIAWELAPTTWKAIWNQRMRWAQGWFQVSLRHGLKLMRSPHFTVQNRIGAFILLGWREVYPWIAIQMFPLIAFVAYISGGLDKLDWLVPIYVFTTIFTLGVGPAQAINAYILANPEIKKHKSWFVYYVLGVGFFYNEYLNAVGRVAQLKEVLKEKAWKVTPRD